MKKLTVSIGITLDDSIVRRLNLCKEKGLSSNDLCGVCKLYEVYGDFAAPIYEAWLKENFGGQGDE